jgi:hypothetical protein
LAGRRLRWDAATRSPIQPSSTSETAL